MFENVAPLFRSTVSTHGDQQSEALEFYLLCFENSVDRSVSKVCSMNYPCCFATLYFDVVLFSDHVDVCNTASEWSPNLLPTDARRILEVWVYLSLQPVAGPWQEHLETSDHPDIQIITPTTSTACGPSRFPQAGYEYKSRMHHQLRHLGLCNVECWNSLLDGWTQARKVSQGLRFVSPE